MISWKHDFALDFSSDFFKWQPDSKCFKVVTRIFDDGGGGGYDAVFDDDDDGLVYAGAEWAAGKMYDVLLLVKRLRQCGPQTIHPAYSEAYGHLLPNSDFATCFAFLPNS